MKNRTIIAFVTIMGLIICLGCKEKITKDKPVNDKPWNIVFILADDMGWNQVKYHGASHYYQTPNIDRVAAEGMSFTDAYAAAPICSPSRASIMTGKYPARLHLTDYLPGNSYPYAKLQSAVQDKNGLALDEVTLAEMLKSQGYTTGHFGKWHLNKDKEYVLGRSGDPGSQGFDDVLATVKPKPDSQSTDAHHVGQITDRTIDFIEKNKDKPFFAYVSHHVVHRPLMEDKDLVNLYKTRQHNENRVNNPIMGAMIERMDRSIGRIMNKLDELALTERTILIFFSDNGGFKHYQDQAPLRGGKAMVFEGGIRVPFAIKWPGMIQNGSVSDVPVITNDFFPTLAEMVGADYNENELDGKSLVPLFNGEKVIDRDAIFWHFPHYHRQGYKPSGAIRMGDYKLIEWYEEAILGEEYAYELYNIKEDIGESNNLANSNPELVSKLKNRLHQWLNDTQANQMSINPNYDPDKQYLPELEWPEGKDYHYIDMHFPNRQQ